MKSAARYGVPPSLRHILPIQLSLTMRSCTGIAEIVSGDRRVLEVRRAVAGLLDSVFMAAKEGEP